MATVADRRIDVAEVARIAALDDPVARNQLITSAYCQLSERLCHRTGGRVANWCTYAVWSSRTVGGAIGATGLPLRARAQLRRLLPERRLRDLVEDRLEAGLPTTRATVGRRLGDGNRDIFLEVATCAVRFLDDGLVDGAPPHVAEGLQWYDQASRAATEDERSEMVLAGTLLLGIHEQQRVQPVIVETFATGAANLVRPLGPLGRPLAGWLAPRWARLMTSKAMCLFIDGDLIPLGRPLRPPPGCPSLYPRTLEDIALPRLRELLDELGIGDEPVQATDWGDYADRMRFIGAFFRSRQQEGCIFGRPDPRGQW